jgi:prepilin-type N-terminal cleavage/methylation domain-containing protein
MRQNKQKITLKGFTIVELLIVVAIIGILAGSVIISTTDSRSKGKYTKVAAEMESVAKAANLYASEHNDTYPTDAGAGSAPNGLIPQYLSHWPTSPCDPAQIQYDWENWQSRHADTWTPVVRISLRRI